MLHHTLTTLSTLADISVSAAPPPGSDKITNVLGYFLWIATVVAAAAFIFAGFGFMRASRRGEGEEATQRLGMVMAGCVVVALSAQLANALT